jgi:putative transposase
VEKREIFLDTYDRNRFVKTLYAANSTKPFEYRVIKEKSLVDIDRGDPLVAIGAYCLMPNHFHLLVKEITEGGISKFMEKLCTGYSMYFNKKYKRSGFLFEGNFKAEYADTDEYLKYLFAYIHLNPVKLIQSDWKETGIRDADKARAYLEKYQYSSYVDFLGMTREEGLTLSPKEFPEYFAQSHDFQYFVDDWLEFRSEAQVGGRALTRRKPK